MTTYGLLVKRAEIAPEKVFLQYKDSQTKVFDCLTGVQVLEIVNRIGCGLIKAGIKPHDAVAIIAKTSLEWVLLDFAIAAVGAVTVPVYETSSTKQIQHIFKDANVKLFFAGTSEITARCATTQVKGYTISESAVAELQAVGEAVDVAEIRRIQSKITGEDISTIVYTSGSTGTPKGVVLQHKAFISIAYDTQLVLPEVVNAPECNLLLFLPLAHGFARFCVYAITACQGVLTLTSTITTLLEDLAIVKPTVLLGVPRIFEKLFNAASHKSNSLVARPIFQQAVRVATQYSQLLETRTKIPLQLISWHKLYDKLVYAKLRKVLGGKSNYAICGGAQLNPDLNHFFRGAGIQILEGYGMTETVAPFCVNRANYNKTGTVGIPFPGVEIRQAYDGELIINAPYQFIKYNNLKEMTKQTLLEQMPEYVATTGKIDSYNAHWLATGDLGVIDGDGFVKIVGKKKDIIVTAGGKNVSPGPLEAIIDANPIVANCVLVGEGRPYISALVTLDIDEVGRFCDRLGRKHFQDLELASRDPAVVAEVQRTIDLANETVSQAESIRKFSILPENFSEDNEMLTASMKIRRNQIVRHYNTYINRHIYS